MRIALGLVAVVIFLLISAGLARVLSANNAERDAIHALVTAEARGDAGEMARLLTACARQPGCRTRQEENARRATRTGEVKLLSVEPGSRFALGETSGTTRVAWQAGTALPVVQCVGIRRTGDVLSGLGVELTSLGPPIDREGTCPK